MNTSGWNVCLPTPGSRRTCFRRDIVLAEGRCGLEVAHTGNRDPSSLACYPALVRSPTVIRNGVDGKGG